MSRRKPKSVAATRTSVADALETLVSQFSQPLAFLRELVQNALDANTNRVEVRVTWSSEEKCATVEVADTGEGMDRTIIDEGLTRLFASSKEGDLTKIGKFGVGFVSVFAIKPLAVVVDTGRGGEAWRIVFNPDRSFDRNRLDQPCDGTRVSVYVPLASEAAFQKFEKDCRDTVSFWCRHCDVEVHFNGSNVVEPFRLKESFQVEHDEQGTHVVVAPCPERAPFHGFYNRGLTLLEGPGSPLAGVTFKCRSRYLEHTITRDNVLQDEHYDKALAVIARAAHQVLPVRLAQALAAAPGEDRLWDLLRIVAAYPQRPAELTTTPLVPGLTRPYALGELTKAVYTDQDGPLARAVLALGVPVITVTPTTSAWAALAACGLYPQPLATYDLAESASASPALTSILNATSGLLRGFQVVPARLHPSRPDSWSLRCTRLGLAVTGPGQGKLLAVEVTHPWLARLVAIAEHDPGLAAYLLAQALMLQHGLPLQDAAFASALGQRRQNPPRMPLPEVTG